MELKGEYELIELLIKKFQLDKTHHREYGEVYFPVGDDVSFLKLRESKDFLLFSVDSLVENIHFKISFPPEHLGWKLISINVSDIVAKGGVPLFGLINISLPPYINWDYLEKIYKGLRKALDFYHLDFLGGNTTRIEKNLHLTFFIIGKAEKIIPRKLKNLKEKKYVFVSGPLGNARAGLEILLRNTLNDSSGGKNSNLQKYSFKSFEKKLVRDFLYPTINLEIRGTILKYAEASIDISDGFISDLSKTCENCEIIIYKENIPISAELLEYCRIYGKNPLEYALYGGEDYQNLIISSQKEIPSFIRVGEIKPSSSSKKTIIKTSEGEILPIKGFEHF